MCNCPPVHCSAKGGGGGESGRTWLAGLPSSFYHAAILGEALHAFAVYPCGHGDRRFWLRHRVSLVAQLVKNLPTMQETWVRSLGWEYPRENGMATHSSILAWRSPWTIPWGHKESDMTKRLSLSRSDPSRENITYGQNLAFYDFVSALNFL